MGSPSTIRGSGFPWANLLSLSRLGLAVLCVFAILESAWSVALLIFIAAVLTDLADGPLARRRGEVTPLGGFLDHVSDASFVSACLAALAWEGVVPMLLPVFVVLAFMQYALDSQVLEGRALRASALGRYNGIAYFVVVGIPIVRGGLGLPFPGNGLIRVLAWLVVISTVASMADRWFALRRGVDSGTVS